MPQYLYKANSVNGTKINGVVSAPSADEARAQLEMEGMSIDMLREQSESSWNKSLSFHVSVHEITFFTKNFSVMLGAGLTVVDSLIIAEAQSTGKLKKILHSILHHVEQGHSLAEGFKENKRYFSGTYIDVIRNGELSGTLSDNMAKLAERLESDLSLRRKIQAALVYPALVVSAIILLTIVLSVYVLPRLTRLFLSLDIDLPLSTKILLWVSQFFINYWLVVGIVLVGLIALIRLLIVVPIVRKMLHAIILRLPVVGSISRSVNLARFAGTLGALLNSGVPISESFESVIHSVTNEVYRDRLQEALLHIEQGGSLAGFLEQHHRLFPPTITRMVAVGERTGRLDEILTYLGKFYEIEVDSATKQLSTTLEPVLLIMIGAAVLFVGLSIITPIYQFTASVGRI